MEDRPVLLRGARILLVVASLIIVVAGLQAAAALLRPFLVSLFLSILSLPLLTGLQRLRIPRPISVLLTMTAVVLVFVGIGLLVGGSLNGFIEAAPRYRERLEQLGGLVSQQLTQRGIDVRDLFDGQKLNLGVVFDFMTGSLLAIAAVLSNTVMVLLTMVFILLEAAGFPDKLRLAFGRPEPALARFRAITEEVQRYLAIKTMISLATGLVVTGWLWLLGVDFPLLWGLIAFVMNYIPNLGSILAAIPPVLLATVQIGIGRAIVVAIGYAVINISLGTLVEPQLMGRRLGLSPLVVFFSLVFWGWVWGPIGMLLSVPLTMILKIMMENSVEFRWIAILLDDRAHPPEAAPPSSSEL
ncbi:MAG: AI-2E family transporter [Acidobacteriota bacterium]|nr:MAG: AI-2E family transporter [Acidobacteriota bacterium]